jgi:FixJ family two-component response regulator
MPPPASDYTVAVVDDDENVLKSLDILLQSADYSVRLFASATALLQSGCLPQIDCLISDIGLPTVDGFELLRLVDRAQPGLPIILITGRSDMLDRVPAGGAADFRVFSKPFDGGALLAAVGLALRSSRPGPCRG